MNIIYLSNRLKCKDLLFPFPLFRRMSDALMGNMKKWDKNLSDAMSMISEGNSLRNASMQCNVSYGTLHRAVKGCISQRPSGRPTVLTFEAENYLFEVAMFAAERGFGMSKTHFIQKAVEILTTQNPTCSQATLKRSLSNKWWIGFRKRHTNAMMKRTSKVDLARVEAEKNDDSILSFYSSYATLDQVYHFDPDQVWSQDETGTTQNEFPRVVVASSSQQKVGIRTSSSEGHISISAAVSAEGLVAPPLFIFSNSEVGVHDLDHAPPGSTAISVSSGYMQDWIFVQWFKNWVTWVRLSTSKPLLLIVDNHSSHLSMEVIELAKKSNVELLALPPNLTHILQPLDVSLFRRLKAAIRRTLHARLEQEGRSSLNNQEFVQLTSESWNQVFTLSHIQESFGHIGLFPFNPNKYFERVGEPHIFTSLIPSENDKMVTMDTSNGSEVERLKLEVAKLKSSLAAVLQEHKAINKRKRRRFVPSATILTQEALKEADVNVAKRPKRKYTKHVKPAQAGTEEVVDVNIK